MNHLTKDELYESIGKPVYVEDLKTISIPKMAYASIVFGWGYKNPFASHQHIKNDARLDITVVQPSALAKHTKYWHIEDYEVTWVAYKKDVYKRQ